jgi:hypothetical protein
MPPAAVADTPTLWPASLMGRFVGSVAARILKNSDVILSLKGRHSETEAERNRVNSHRALLLAGTPNRDVLRANPPRANACDARHSRRGSPRSLISFPYGSFPWIWKAPRALVKDLKNPFAANIALLTLI